MRKHYFPVVSIFLLILSVIAFSDNLFTDVHQESNSDPKFIVHGLLMFAWFLVFVIQTNFIRTGNRKAHIAWGVAGMLVALGVFISTVYVFIAVFKGWDAMPFYAKQNRFYMLSFAVLVALAYKARREPARHKRFMLMASLLILEPILGRVTGHLGLNEIFIEITWNALFLSLFLYDWVTIKRIHPITWIGFLWFYVVLAICLIV